jgi:hypothetical protein
MIFANLPEALMMQSNLSYQVPLVLSRAYG